MAAADVEQEECGEKPFKLVVKHTFLSYEPTGETKKQEDGRRKSDGQVVYAGTPSSRTGKAEGFCFEREPSTSGSGFGEHVVDDDEGGLSISPSSRRSSRSQGTPLAKMVRLAEAGPHFWPPPPCFEDADPDPPGEGGCLNLATLVTDQQQQRTDRRLSNSSMYSLCTNDSDLDASRLASSHVLSKASVPVGAASPAFVPPPSGFGLAALEEPDMSPQQSRHSDGGSSHFTTVQAMSTQRSDGRQSEHSGAGWAGGQLLFTDGSPASGGHPQAMQRQPWQQQQQQQLQPQAGALSPAAAAQFPWPPHGDEPPQSYGQGRPTRQEYWSNPPSMQARPADVPGPSTPQGTAAFQFGHEWQQQQQQPQQGYVVLSASPSPRRCQPPLPSGQQPGGGQYSMPPLWQGGPQQPQGQQSSPRRQPAPWGPQSQRQQSPQRKQQQQPRQQKQQGKGARRGDHAHGHGDGDGSSAQGGRTTVMLKNLPVGLSREMLSAALDRVGFRGGYDFLYVPISFRTKVSMCYAFVNMRSPALADALFTGLQGFWDWGHGGEQAICEVTWSEKVQGFAHHIERYRNSPLMHPSVPDEYKPAAYQDGVRIRFPPPTRAIKAPRLRRDEGEDESPVGQPQRFQV